MENTEEKNKPSPDPIKISGRFDQYRSSYWAALVALLPARYLLRPFNRKHWGENSGATYFEQHKYSGIVGLAISGITAFYALKTWGDMRSIFSEALAWELDKDPKVVGFMDLWKSKNTIIQQTMHNYIGYNFRRFAVNSTFFSPFIFKSFFKRYNMHPETGADFGVAANGLYLFRDIMVRRMTAFEELQTLIDRKVNHTDSFSDKITAEDLLNVYERNAVKGITHSFLSQRGTPGWENVMAFFERMADLMNQTYKNRTPTEKANFGMPEFIYMVGNKLINPDNLECSRTYVEIANRDGIPQMKKTISDIQKGTPLEHVRNNCGLNVPTIAQPLAQIPAAAISMTEREDLRRAEKPAHDGMRLI